MKPVLLLLGSSSDWKPEMQAACQGFDGSLAIQVKSGSCHRTPEESRKLAEFIAMWRPYGLVIVAGSESLGQPGNIVSWVRSFGDAETQIVGVALGDPGTEGFDAAILAIKRMPNKTVVVKENGEPFCRAAGLREVLEAYLAGTLPKAGEWKYKPIDPNVWHN